MRWMLLVVLLAIPLGSASAKEMDGRFGIGLEQSLAGVTGLSMRYFASEALAIHTALGVDITIIEGKASAGVAGSAGVALQLARSQHAHLWIGLRGALGYRSLDAFRITDPSATDSDLHFALEIPLGLEVWVSDNFSLGASTGILINIVPGGGAQLHGEGAGSSAPPGSVGIGIGAGSVTATIAVMYYF